MLFGYGSCCTGLPYPQVVLLLKCTRPLLITRTELKATPEYMKLKPIGIWSLMVSSRMGGVVPQPVLPPPVNL